MKHRTLWSSSDQRFSWQEVVGLFGGPWWAAAALTWAAVAGISANRRWDVTEMSSALGNVLLPLVVTVFALSLCPVFVAIQNSDGKSSGCPTPVSFGIAAAILYAFGWAVSTLLLVFVVIPDAPVGRGMGSALAGFAVLVLCAAVALTVHSVRTSNFLVRESDERLAAAEAYVRDVRAENRNAAQRRRDLANTS